MLGSIVATLAPRTIISLKDSPITPGSPTPILYAILTADLPDGLDESVFVYFENPSGNLAANVRQAIKSTSVSNLGYTIETWS
jgi:hypothetical protein